MMQQDHKPQSVFKSKNVLISYITVLVLLIIFSSIAFYDAKIFGLKSLATDFNAFNDAGNISLRTNASDAYNIRLRTH